MTGWSYSGNPSASPLDEVRFLIGDVDAGDPQMTNDEITYLLRLAGGNTVSAAISGVRGLIARYARTVDEAKTVGDLSLSTRASGRVEQYEKVLAALSEQAFVRGGGVPIYTATAGQFAIGQMDNA
jgi:hypothetical protein